MKQKINKIKEFWDKWDYLILAIIGLSIGIYIVYNYGYML